MKKLTLSIFVLLLLFGCSSQTSNFQRQQLHSYDHYVDVLSLESGIIDCDYKTEVYHKNSGTVTVKVTHLIPNLGEVTRFIMKIPSGYKDKVNLTTNSRLYFYNEQGNLVGFISMGKVK